MFYHIEIALGQIESDLYVNKTREEILVQYLCPFLNREIAMFKGAISNLMFLGSMRIWETDKPVDSVWPINRKEHKRKSLYIDTTVLIDGEIIRVLEKEANNVSEQFYAEAITMIESGKYKEQRAKIVEVIKGSYSFFICALDNDEVMHNYEFVIKPAIKQFNFDIQKADEISHTGTITGAILSAINRSRFLVADLTDEKPNCYYEVGYAHALGKPVIILAKEGTHRHFDISTYKWNFWKDYIDLKPKFEKELQSVLQTFKTKSS